MSLLPLDDLDQDDQRAIRQMLQAVVAYPEVHGNGFQVQRELWHTFSHYVYRHSGEVPSPLPFPVTSRHNLGEILRARGFAEKTQTEGHYRFTDQALAWYQQPAPLSNQEIQSRLGQYLFDQHLIGDIDRATDRLDLGEVAAKLGVTRDRLVANARILEDMGFVTSGPYGGRRIEDGHIYLTKPQGVQWANDGAPPVRADGSPVVSVTVHVTLQQVIQQVEQLDTSEEMKERIELLLRRFEEEAKKDEPSYKPMMDLLEAATKVKDLAPIVVKFFGDHMDTISQMAHRLPGID